MCTHPMGCRYEDIYFLGSGGLNSGSSSYQTSTLLLSYTPSPAFLVLNNGVALGKQGGLQDAKHTRHLEVVGQLVIARWRGKSIHSQE